MIRFLKKTALPFRVRTIVPVPDRVSTPAKLYLSAIVLNSFANGIWNVVLQLYLISLGFDSNALGSIFMVYPLGVALLTIPAGILADRYGRGKIMILKYSLIVLDLILLLISKSVETFRLVFFLLGLADGAGVVLDPFYSSLFDRGDLDKAFGLRGFLNIMSNSIGTLLGFIPPILVVNYGFSTQASYWSLVALGVAFFFVEIPFRIMPVITVEEPKRDGKFRFNLKSKSIVAKFSIINIISGIGLGSFFSFFTYYVNKKFGVGSDALSTLYFLSRFVSAGANVIAPKVSNKLGTLKTITVTTALCGPFLLMFPFAPNFTWLAAFYMVRLFLVIMSGPLISSLFYRLLYEEEKATANSITSMVSQCSGIVAPKLGGRLLEVSLDVPAFLAAGTCPVLAVSSYFLLRNEKEKSN